MKTLSKPEFFERVKRVQDAHKIFGHMTDNDMTRAFEAYQEILAEKPRAIYITKNDQGEIRAKFLDRFKRPRCPECGAELFIRPIFAPQGPTNIKGYQSSWFCQEGDCIHERFSTKSIRWQIKQLELKKKRRR